MYLPTLSVVYEGNREHVNWESIMTGVPSGKKINKTMEDRLVCSTISRDMNENKVFRNREFII